MCGGWQRRHYGPGSGDADSASAQRLFRLGRRRPLIRQVARFLLFRRATQTTGEFLARFDPRKKAKWKPFPELSPQLRARSMFLSPGLIHHWGSPSSRSVAGNLRIAWAVRQMRRSAVWPDRMFSSDDDCAAWIEYRAAKKILGKKKRGRKGGRRPLLAISLRCECSARAMAVFSKYSLLIPARSGSPWETRDASQGSRFAISGSPKRIRKDKRGATGK